MENTHQHAPKHEAPETAEQTVQLTQKEKVFAATNDPSLATDQFTLGERSFPVLYLKYKAQLKFIAHLQPLLELVGGAIAGGPAISGLELGTRLNLASLMQYCAEDLPAMVALMCQQSDKEVTAEWVEDNCEGPVQLAGIVLKQVGRNRFVPQILDFFVQILPTLMMVKKARAS